MRNKKTKFNIAITLLALIWLGYACTYDNNDAAQISLEDFPNVLNIQNVPKEAKDWSAYCFADKGAWFGYALPDTNIQASLGTFPGPFLMTHGKWISKALTTPKIFNVKTGKEFLFAEAKSKSINYFPGRLEQIYLFDEVSVQLELIFVSANSAAVYVRFENRTTTELELSLDWQTETFDLPVKFEMENKSLKIQFPESGYTFNVAGNFESVEEFKEKSFKLSVKPILLKGSEVKVSSLLHSFNYNEKDYSKEEAKFSSYLTESQKYLEENNSRWAGYLTKTVLKESGSAADYAEQQIAVKSVQTLINNWKKGIGSLTNDGIIPSYAIWYFNGFWAWDSWKHAVGVAKFEPELAKNQMRVMFDKQDKFGMIPDVIYADSTEDNWRDTKPPLAAWAVWKIYEETNDKEFVKEFFDKLLKYHYWWYENRDHDKNGLCEYGSTDGTLVAAMWESGMDDAVRYDKAKMLKNNEHAWSVDQESVDLNAYLFAEKNYLSKMAELLSKIDISKKLKNEAAQLKSDINKNMFNEQTGFYHDIKVEDKSFISVQGPEGWIPLWAGVAEAEHAKAVVKTMTDTTKFATFIPFPTVAADNEKYMTGYWRGPVWLDQAYFAVKALRNYNYKDEADKFTEQMFTRLEGLKNSGMPIRENYDPRNGKGLKVNHFSWSAVSLLLLYQDF